MMGLPQGEPSSFAGKSVLISGGAGGIGAATARLLAARGAAVVLGDLAGSAGPEIALEIGGVFVELDVTREDHWAAAVARVLELHGRLDVLVNSAGIVGDVVAGALETTSLAEWRRVLAVNLDGTFLGCRAAVAPMRAAGRGAIVNLASVGAYYPTTQSVAYGASKGGVTQLTKSVAMFASQGGKRVRCNSVHPGRTATPMLDSILTQRAQRSDAVQGSSAERIPLGPEGQPEDVAALIAFLASDQADYITGSEFVVDGGWCLLR